MIEQAREKKEGIYSGQKALDPGMLSNECLRYMYRLLFLFYIEAAAGTRLCPHPQPGLPAGLQPGIPARAGDGAPDL